MQAPIRLVMIKLDFCDICCKSYKNVEFFHVDIIEHLGWRICDSCKPCFTNTIGKWFISKESLDKEFGDKFLVVRSNGKVDCGLWSIATAYRTHENSEIMACITRNTDTDTLQKYIPIDTLREWQKSI